MDPQNVVDTVELLPGLSNAGYLSRLANYPPVSHTALKVKSYSLNNVKEQRVQEALVVRDLLNVLMGQEGIYIRYNNSYDPAQRDMVEIRGPDFKIAKNIDLSVKSVARRVVRFGKAYQVLVQFVDRYEEPEFGSVLHGLCHEIRAFLKHKYLRCVVNVAEKDFHTRPQFGVRELEQLLAQECAPETLLLQELVDEICREMTRRALMDRDEANFNRFIQDLQVEKKLGSTVLLMTDSRVSSVAKGGAVLQIVQTKLNQNWGNQRDEIFLKTLFRRIAVPYCHLLHNWLTNGTLNDLYDEFLIMDTAQSGNKRLRVTSLNSERLWDTQYVVRKDGLMAQFQDETVLFKILLTGKLLNMFRHCTNVQDLSNLFPIENNAVLTEIPQNMELVLYVDKLYLRANRLAQSLLYEGYDLMNLLQEFRTNFLFDNNANFFKYFFNRNIVELTKTRSDATLAKLSRSFAQFQKTRPNNGLVLSLLNLRLENRNFASTVDQFSSEHAIFDDNVDLLQARNFDNLRDMLLKDLTASWPESDSTATETNLASIHFLQFEIIVPFPLNTLITKTHVVQIQLIQRYLLLLKYYHKMVNDTWFELNKNKIWRYSGYTQDVASWIRRCRVLHFRMTQFMNLLLESTVRDVVAVEWQGLQQMLSLGASDAHQFDFYLFQQRIQDFLTNIISHSLLTKTSVVRLLLRIVDIIHKFCKFVTSQRKALCFMDIHLFNRYQDQLADDALYDEDAAINRFQELNTTLSALDTSFKQHCTAFVEGVKYYNDRAGVSQVALNLMAGWAS
ncbi:LAMI_0F15016g1_1 [Lachancea mirantina]|uniref:Spindle pole body component n=1 Tax=Lachancea mirantina TaxID=1230905 RepID=A0A1G4K449_9SACH|nr:LAMI_0F15016g1_1 [Lachancea mirantina]